MVQESELYQILVSYSNKNNSPYIDIDAFFTYMDIYAKSRSGEGPSMQKWVKDKAIRFWSELSSLAKEGKLEFLNEKSGSRIYMPDYYAQILEKAYQNADKNADFPLFTEENLGITPQKDQIRCLNTEIDLFSFLEEPAPVPVQVLKLIFPDGFSSALILSSMVPKLITETCLLKMRNYLHRYGNKEYASNKLNPQFQSRESFLQNQLDKIALRPLDLYYDLEKGGEFSRLFWNQFCALVKDDIKKKKERLPMDIAAFQSVCIIEVINGHFESILLQQRETELAFKSLESQLAQPPYLYSMTEIVKFKGPNGEHLIRQYTAEGLEVWLKNKTAESTQNELPELLIMRSTANDDLNFLLKEKMVSFCSRLVIDGRFLLKDAVIRYWQKLLLEFKKEPAMEINNEFEKLLLRFTKKHCPVLTDLFADPKLILVYQELEKNNITIPAAARIIGRGELLPYSAIFQLRRYDLLQNAKLGIPFWYTMPIISAIVAFFCRSRKSKRNVAALEDEIEQYISPGRQSAKEAVKEIEASLIPKGYTRQLYLEDLEDRWSRLISPKARKDLIENVKDLTKDSIRRTLKLQRNFKPNKEILNQMVYELVIRNPTLSALSSRDALITYMELQMIMYLKNVM